MAFLTNRIRSFCTGAQNTATNLYNRATAATQPVVSYAKGALVIGAKFALAAGVAAIIARALLAYDQYGQRPHEPNEANKLDKAIRLGREIRDLREELRQTSIQFYLVVAASVVVVVGLTGLLLRERYMHAHTKAQLCDVEQRAFLLTTDLGSARALQARTEVQLRGIEAKLLTEEKKIPATRSAQAVSNSSEYSGFNDLKTKLDEIE